MKNKINLVMLLVLILSVPLSVAADSGPSLKFAVLSSDQQSIVLELQGRGVENLGGFDFEVWLDGASAHIESVHVQSEVLAQNGRESQPLGPYLSSDGTLLSAGAYSYGSSAAGISGDMGLGQITLTLAHPGLSALYLENAALVAPDASLLLTSTARHDLYVSELAPGWNLFAPCVNPGGEAYTQTLHGIAGQYDQVLGANGTSLTSLNPGEAYWLRSTSGNSLTLGMIGAHNAPTVEQTLEPGWHWIGHCMSNAQTISDTFASISGKYDRVIGARGAYVPGLGASYQSLTTFEFGAGYLLHMTESAAFVYPQNGNAAVETPDLCTTPAAPTPYSTLLYGQIIIDGEVAPEGTQIEVLTPREEIAGCGRVHEGGRYGLLHAYGQDAEGVTAGFLAEEQLTLRVDNCSPVTTDLNWQNDKSPHFITINVVEGVCTLSTQIQLYLPAILKQHAG